MLAANASLQTINRIEDNRSQIELRVEGLLNGNDFQLSMYMCIVVQQDLLFESRAMSYGS